MEEVDREETQEVMEAQGVPEEESVQEQGDDEVNNCDDNQTDENGDSDSARADGDEPTKTKSELKERTTGKKGNRFQPYSKDRASSFAEKRGRNRVFISNIPYDMKWQAIKDLMRDKVGEVTYVELFKDAEGKSRGCGVVEFKDADYVKKAVDVMVSHDLNGRPLNIREDFEGDHARRALNRGVATFSTTPGGDRAVPLNIPPAIMNNPNIPPEILNALQAGRLGSTVFVANLDFKVGWKKLKEVFGMAGTVKRADIKEDQDGKSRGMGTVTFENAIEAVQAISMFNQQMLFERVMHVKMDDKSIPQDEFRSGDGKTPQLPRGLGGIGMGLGPGGQPLNAHMGVSSGMGNMGPAGMGGPGFGGMNRMGTGVGGFGGMDGMSNMGGFGVNRMSGMSGVDDFRGNLGIGMSGGMANSMGGMGSGMGGMASSMGDLYRAGMGNMDRDFTRDMAMNRSFGDSFGGMDLYRAGMGNMDRDFTRDMAMNRNFGDSFGGMAGAMVGGFGGMTPSGMGPVGSGMGGGMGTMNNMAVGLGMDRMGSTFDRMGAGLGMDRAFGGFGASQAGSGKRGFTKGCQIFVRNLPFDLVWQKLKEKFSPCGHVLYAEVKMENGKSKGCGTVRFDSPETAEKACRLMNGTKINGREIDVRMDRNA